MVLAKGGVTRFDRVRIFINQSDLDIGFGSRHDAGYEFSFSTTSLERKPMIYASDLGYPDFDEAEARLLAFVRRQGLNLQIIHVRRDDLILMKGRWFARRVEPKRSRSQARLAYEEAVTRGLGVSLTGHCVLNNAIGVYVYGPVDANEAERLMYPNGLKLSVVVALPKTEVVGPLWWALLRARQLLRPEPTARADLLK